MNLGASCTFVQDNPKRVGSKSYERYEAYKSATSLDEVLKLGGLRADIKFDVEKGYCVVDGGLVLNSPPRKKQKEEWYVDVVTQRRPGDEKSSELHGPFVSKEAAVEEARSIRRSMPGFVDEENDDDALDSEPPWASPAAQDDLDDEAEEVLIRVMSASAVEKNKKKEAERAERDKEAPTLPPISTEECVVGYDATLSPSAAQDLYLFARTPADPSLGGTPHQPTRFDPKFVHAIGRISNECYSVSAFATHRQVARFALKKFAGYSKERVWVPPPGAARGGPSAPSKLLDAVTTDLWPDPSKCPCPHDLDPQRLITAAKRDEPEHLYVLGVLDSEALAETIRACPKIKVVCFAECLISVEILEALQTKSDALQAINFANCRFADTADEHDEAFADLLEAATSLVWLGIYYCGIKDGSGLGPKSWRALPSSLEVFHYGASFDLGNFDGAGLRGCHNFLKPFYADTIPRLTNLKFLCVLPDNNGKSRVDIGQKPGDPPTIHDVRAAPPR